jgi:hypothetical protein
MHKSGTTLITEERKRQIQQEGWFADHDDRHKRHQLTMAAISYACAVAHPDEWAEENGKLPGPTSDWPWGKKWWKPSADPVRNLVKAGALIAAEIDRIQRIPKCKKNPCSIRLPSVAKKPSSNP